jgi:hypothetical protein
MLKVYLTREPPLGAVERQGTQRRPSSEETVTMLNEVFAATVQQ